MSLGIAILGLIILIDIGLMVIIMRAIATEPPHKHPSAHPLALRYAAGSTEAAQAESAEPEAAETAEAAADDDETDKTELGE